MRATTRALGLLLAAAAGVAIACSSDSANPPSGPTSAISLANRPFFTSLPTGYRLEVLLDGLALPTSLAATPDGRLLVTEQETGKVRVVQDGRLLAEPWFELPVFTAEEEEFIAQELGLVTIAVDPLFAENGFVYIYYTEQDDDGSRRTVFGRLREVEGRGTDLTKLVTIELAPIKRHIAGGIAFDGDGAILLGVGDHELPELAPRLDSLAGKVLRIDREGAALPDNPFVGRADADPRVFAYGLRNPFGVTVDRLTGRAYITENRNVAGDAVYELVAAADYGWPTDEIVLREPLVIYDVPMGMAGIVAYGGDALPEFAGDLFYCTYHNGGGLHWSEPGPVDGYDLARRDRLIAPGCNTGVTEGADGFLYLLVYGEGKLMRISR
ncbi:MAG: PQQ-dependent sugar dehydrogenase [Chloroflexi bacterium]|nr:PQQ-dependent sugar dehydrogenase [Chloroflexota bacterium]